MTVIASGAQPIDIVVEPNLRQMFWSTLDHGIFAASMDGSDKRSLVDRGIEWASGLTIDHSAQRLYWADHRKGTIETVLLNGKSRHVVTQFRNRSKCLCNIKCVRYFCSEIIIKGNIFCFSAAMLPKRIQVFEDSLYITLVDQKIYRANKFGHSEGAVMVENFQRASDLFILHPLQQDSKSKYLDNFIETLIVRNE